MDGHPSAVDPVRAASPNRAVIFAIWHNRLVVLTYLHRKRGVHALRSSSRDGLLIAEILRRWGYTMPAGSSSRGGASGLRKLVATARGGTDVAITVDGPRGPRGRVKPGIIQLAAMSGNPIVPITAAVKRGHRFASWDRTLMGWPFTKIRLRYGEPLKVPRNLTGEEMETHRLELERRLTRLVDDNDRAMGSEVIPPAPPEVDGEERAREHTAD